MSTEAVLLMNLPVGITGEELMQQLLEQLPQIFDEARRQNRLTTFTFCGRNSTDPWQGVVFGFSCNFENLQLLFRGLMFHHGNDRRYQINIKPDTGERRNEQGGFLVAKAGNFRRDLERLCAITEKKIVRIFVDPFLRSVNLGIFNGFNNPFLMKHQKPWQFLTGERDHPGYMQIFRLKDKEHVLAMYGSPLESLQAIAYFNQNPNVVTAESNVPQVCSTKNLDMISTCNRRGGLGIKGAMIDIGGRALMDGFVPIDDFDRRLIDWQFKQRIENTTTCTKCNTFFTILGVNHNLNYVAAKCGICEYDRSLKPQDEKRAIFFREDTFTRLMLQEHCNFDVPLEKPALIMYEPVKRIYLDQQDFLEIMIPLIKLEWLRYSEGYQHGSQRQGRITRAVNIQVHDNGVEHPRTATVALTVSIPFDINSKYWQEDNPSCLKEVNLTIERVQRDRPVFHRFNAKLYTMIIRGPNIELTVKAEIPTAFLRIIPLQVTVYALPNKSEFVGVKRILRFWNENTFKHVMAEVIINPVKFLRENYHLALNAIPLKPNSDPALQAMLAWIDRNLNAEQTRALWAAVKNSLAFIQGPPGTGKTFLAAVIAYYLHKLEKGKLVMCAPANFAVENLASAVPRVQVRGCEDPRILRIFARSKESYPLTNAPVPGRYGVLHVLVQQHPNYLLPAEFNEIRRKVNGNMMAEMTNQEEEMFWDHVRTLEFEIMEQFDIFCVTVGALADYRVETWNKKIKISTVILDEGGQLFQPHTLHVLRLHAKRNLVIGDPQQLRAQAQCMESRYAGYDKSVMEMMLLAEPLGDRGFAIPPYTVLLEQHRMHPDICEVVSRMTYGGNLRCSGDLIRGRSQTHVPPLEKMYKNKRVIILDHKSPDEKVGHSFKNSGEASLIMLEINCMLKNKGVNQQDIIVVTLYESQRKEIESRLEQLGYMDIRVENCDAIQGRESPIVLVSLVRNNDEQSMGFLDTENRINVAFSRAQDFLVIAGAMPFFGKSKISHWRKFTEIINDMTAKGKCHFG